jgi:NitT/TauT family transport system substrate-binding protein
MRSSDTNTGAGPVLTPLEIAPTGMRLHEWIALERGYFEQQGIRPIVRWDVVAGTMASWRGQGYLERPQDRPFVGASPALDVTNACAWGSICNAAAGMGKFVPDAYGVARWAIYVRPDSPIRRPPDLADVPIAVGLRAGSHFNVPYRLEPYLPLARIRTTNVGGFGARLRALLEGEVEAASLLDPQISMADQLGLRRVMHDTFKTLWWVPADLEPGLLAAYFRTLERADADLERDPAACLPLWRYSIPAEFRGQAWDFGRFDVGERFVRRPLARAEFDELVRSVERWGLDDHMRTKAFDQLALRVAV